MKKRLPCHNKSERWAEEPWRRTDGQSRPGGHGDRRGHRPPAGGDPGGRPCPYRRPRGGTSRGCSSRSGSGTSQTRLGQRRMGIRSFTHNTKRDDRTRSFCSPLVFFNFTSYVNFQKSKNLSNSRFYEYSAQITNHDADSFGYFFSIDMYRWHMMGSPNKDKWERPANK